jgi:hypothetical protein
MHLLVYDTSVGQGAVPAWLRMFASGFDAWVLDYMAL